MDLIQGDCLEEMAKLPDGCIDMVMADPPYGTTACSWDSIIPFEPMWKELKRLIRPNGAIVMTASQPFTSVMICSNLKMFRYCWVWEKEQGTNFLCADKNPLRVHEDVAVFYGNGVTYNPQMTWGSPYISGKGNSGEVTGGVKKTQTVNQGTRYPKSIQRFQRITGLHPTQKPTALFEYLIKTYTNEGDRVLDFCAGSGTTGIACQNINRDFILIERDQEYFDLIQRDVGERSNKFMLGKQMV